jgi:hypothetical protein
MCDVQLASLSYDTWKIHERKIQTGSIRTYKEVVGQFRSRRKHICRELCLALLTGVNKAKTGRSKKRRHRKKSSISEFEVEQDYVLPVSDTHSNISVGLDSDKQSADLPLWDETYRPNVGDYVIVSFEGK